MTDTGLLLRMGANGEAVRAFQLMLRDRGYALTGTGYFGAQTDSAVEDFQRKHGVAVTGVIDQATATLLSAPAPKPTTDPVPLWLSVSLAHLGLHEGVGSKDNPELISDIRTVASDYQHDATPWCAGWVSFCLAKAGEKPSSQPLWALSYSDTRNQPVIKLAGPALGAIAVKTRNGGGHVTFVSGRTRSGVLACCGGNQNDQVSVEPYAASVFVGFYWPKGAVLPRNIGIDKLPIVTTSGQPIHSEA